MNITVYLGASEGFDPIYKNKVIELGHWIGNHGHTLVYGGSKTGLMGELAHSVLNTGGKVIGVEPQFFIDQEVQLTTLTQLIITKDMPERKTKMIELGDVFIAFPGGTGTLEEISEVMTKSALKQIEASCIIYNLNGYYDDLQALLKKMIDEEFYTKEKQKNFYFIKDLNELKEIIENED